MLRHPVLRSILILLLSAASAWVPVLSAPAGSAGEPFPLALVKTDDPRDTMRTFLDAMIDYKQGVDSGDARLERRIDDAVRTLDLSEVKLLPEQTGRDAAIYLKEVIDRTILIKYEYIPSLDSDDPKYEEWKSEMERRSFRWRLRNTQITVRRVEQGPRKGEYLFTPDTVARAKDWYERVRHLPYVGELAGPRRGTGYRKPWLEEATPDWMNDSYLGLAIWQYVGLAIMILVGLIVKVFVGFAIGLVGRLVARSESEWDDRIVAALSGPIGYVAAVGLWFVSLHMLRFEGVVLSILTVALKIYFSMLLIWLAYRLSGVFTEYLRLLSAKTESTLDDQLVPLLNRTLKILIVVSGALLAIQNLGFNVLSLLAGLGIGGLAFALAAKDTVANFFGSLMILFDRPFQVGDWITVGSADGTVEEIGFRSTRIRTFYNSVISVPNSEVANAKVDNLGLREFRRVKTTLGVTYDTPPEKMEAFLEGIKNIIRANPHTRKDYFHVVFNDYGPSSLNVLVYFFLKVPNWSDELVERQNVLLEVLRLAKELEVEFAFPTETVHLFQETTPAGAAVDLEAVRSGAASFGPGGAKSRPGGSGLFVPPHREGNL